MCCRLQHETMAQPGRAAFRARRIATFACPQLLNSQSDSEVPQRLPRNRPDPSSDHPRLALLASGVLAPVGRLDPGASAPAHCYRLNLSGLSAGRIAFYETVNLLTALLLTWIFGRFEGRSVWEYGLPLREAFGHVPGHRSDVHLRAAALQGKTCAATVRQTRNSASALGRAPVRRDGRRVSGHAGARSVESCPARTSSG
jgi:hypothetical protein